MGWSVYDYYTSSPREFHAACEGYSDKMKDLSIPTRNLTAVLLRIGGSKSTIDSVWPVAGSREKNRGFEQPTKEFWEQMKVIHGYKPISN